MKRDMDLIRLLLMKVEADESLGELEKYDQKEVAYNAALIIEAGLAEGVIARHGFGEILRADLDRLTWAGHDFLDAARDNTLWKKAKETVMKPAASFTFDIVKAWLKAEISLHLGTNA